MYVNFEAARLVDIDRQPDTDLDTEIVEEDKELVDCPSTGLIRQAVRENTPPKVLRADPKSSAPAHTPSRVKSEREEVKKEVEDAS